MIPIDNVVTGISQYLDCEIMPHLPPVKAIAVGTVAALYLRKSDAILKMIPEYLGIVNEEGIDVDCLRDIIKSQIKDKIPIDIPMIGRITIDKSEIDKLYKYITSDYHT